MSRTIFKRLTVTAAVCFAATFSTGCIEALAATSSYGIGVLVSNLLPLTQQDAICYENGVQVDCATLPAEIRPG